MFLFSIKCTGIRNYSHLISSANMEIVGLKKLVNRNERLIKSNHPLSHKIIAALGATPKAREKETLRIYNEILDIVGEKNVWGGGHNFMPENDPFYRSMVSMMLGQRL